VRAYKSFVAVTTISVRFSTSRHAARRFVRRWPVPLEQEWGYLRRSPTYRAETVLRLT
jgi:hypothetical protein